MDTMDTMDTIKNGWKKGSGCFSDRGGDGGWVLQVGNDFSFCEQEAWEVYF